AFFVALGLAQVGWAALVAILGPSRRLLIAATANIAVVALWIASRTAGLPLGPHTGAPEAPRFADVAATGFEVVLVGCARWSMRPKRSQSGRAIARLAWVLPLAVAPVTIAAIVATVGAAGPG